MVFRLDFQRPNFDIINSPGTVMKILSGMGEQYWPEFKDDSANRRVSTSSVDKEKGTLRQITVEPTAITFVLELATGIDLNSVDTDDAVSALFKGIHSLCDAFNINEIQRAGIRFTALGEIKESTSGLGAVFNKLIDGELVRSVNASLGDIKDIGLAFDGEGADKLCYHCRLGPFEVNEAAKYLTAPTAKVVEDIGSPTNLIFDLDIYEEKFAMTVSAAKWSKRPMAKAKQLALEVQSYLSKKI
jgi:hypothetical protein